MKSRNQLISIIIPVYNVYQYLECCLKSVLTQTYHNLEIILIDDGSIDGSGNICDEYAQRDSRIVVLHQMNRGVSSARNKGIEMARGDYVLFIDADDYIDRSYVKSLYEKLNLADVVICGYRRKTGNQGLRLLEKEGLLEREELFFHVMCTNVIHGSCWNKIFSRKILENCNITFHENIDIGEDMVFVTEYLQHCTSYYYINKPLYFYRMNEQSALHYTYSTKKFNEKNISCLDCIALLEDIAEHENEEIRNCIGYRAVRSSIRLMLQMILGDYADQSVMKRIRVICRRNYWRYIRVKAGTGLEKIFGLILCFSPYLGYQGGKLAVNSNIISLNKYIEQ